MTPASGSVPEFDGTSAYIEIPSSAGFSAAVVPRDWIHVTGVADGTNVHMFKDGSLRHTETYTGTIVPQAGSARYESVRETSRVGSKARFRDVAVWSRALSAAEIFDLYANGTVPAADLVASYPLAHDPVPDEGGSSPGEGFGLTWSSLD